MNPCPFHADKRPILVYFGEGPSSIAECEEDYWRDSPGSAQCDCGASGPTDYSFDGCIAAWNTRPVEDALVEALKVFVNAAESWHNFHKHTDGIQCDQLCAAIEPARAALKLAGK
jgi:hypothetical protein